MIPHDPAFAFIDRLLDPARWGDRHPVGARLHPPSQINVNAGQYNRRTPWLLILTGHAHPRPGKPPFVHWREQRLRAGVCARPHDWFALSAYARAHAHLAHGPLPRHYPPSRPPAGVERHRHDAWRAQAAGGGGRHGRLWLAPAPDPGLEPRRRLVARFGLPADPGQGVSGGACSGLAVQLRAGHSA